MFSHARLSPLPPWPLFCRPRAPPAPAFAPAGVPNAGILCACASRTAWVRGEDSAQTADDHARTTRASVHRLRLNERTNTNEHSAFAAAATWPRDAVHGGPNRHGSPAVGPGWQTAKLFVARGPPRARPPSPRPNATERIPSAGPRPAPGRLGRAVGVGTSRRAGVRATRACRCERPRPIRRTKFVLDCWLHAQPPRPPARPRQSRRHR